MIDVSLISIPAAVIINAYFALWISLTVIYLCKKPRQPIITNSSKHQVSIIIPARDEEDVIVDIVKDLTVQTFKNLEIIVVAHNCSDNTFSRVANLPNVKAYVLNTREFGKGLALQHGMVKASGDLIAYFDADNRVPATTIEQLVNWIDKGYDGVQAKISSKNSDQNNLTFLQHIEFLIYPIVYCGGKHRLGKNSGIGGTGVMVKKEAIKNAGGFRNVLIEDYDMLIRLTLKSFKVAYAQDVVVFDQKVSLLTALIRQRARWIAGHFQLWKTYSLKDKLRLLKNPIDFLYFYNPLCTAALSTSYLLSAIQLSTNAITFQGTPLIFWAASMVALNLMFSSLLHKQEKYGLLKEILLPYALYVFSFHWFLAFGKSFFINGWSDTKTHHEAT